MSGVPQMHLTMLFFFNRAQATKGLWGGIYWGTYCVKGMEVGGGGGAGGFWDAWVVVPPKTWENWERGWPRSTQGAGNIVLEED